MALSSKRVYNHRITRARTVECTTFGMVAKKFGIFQTSIGTSVKVSEVLVELHNFIKHENNFNYFLSAAVHDVTHSHSSNTRLTAAHSTRPTAEVMAVPDILTKYFVSPCGALGWQD